MAGTTGSNCTMPKQSKENHVGRNDGKGHGLRVAAFLSRPMVAFAPSGLIRAETVGALPPGNGDFVRRSTLPLHTEQVQKYYA
ncbi:hypothetical protein [Sphingobium cloacae]|uniref:hypothetical protein n=1 Tax=Sphingobium cloacae TaxID=120107 RepID=UPI000AA5F19B|nr:hypothetical protein [Sphingobium cloacae]